jgi:hypothetical protein
MSSDSEHTAQSLLADDAYLTTSPAFAQGLFVWECADPSLGQ